MSLSIFGYLILSLLLAGAVTALFFCLDEEDEGDVRGR